MKNIPGIKMIPDLCQFGKIVLTTEWTLPGVAFTLSEGGSLVKFFNCGFFVDEPGDGGHDHFALVKGLGRLLGHHVKDLFWGGVNKVVPEVFVHIVKL